MQHTTCDARRETYDVQTYDVQRTIRPATAGAHRPRERATDIDRPIADSAHLDPQQACRSRIGVQVVAHDVVERDRFVLVHEPSQPELPILIRRPVDRWCLEELCERELVAGMPGCGMKRRAAAWCVWRLEGAREWMLEAVRPTPFG